MIWIMTIFTVHSIQRIKVFLLLSEFLFNFSYKAIFIIWNTHHIEVITHNFLYSLHLRSCNDLSLGDGCLANFTLLTEHIQELRIIRLYSCSTILDGNFLLINKHSSHISNINLSPTIRNSLISALNICHRGWKISSMLCFQIFFHLCCCISVWFCSLNIGLCTT